MHTTKKHPERSKTWRWLLAAAIALIFVSTAAVALADPIITVTKIDTLLTDNDNDGLADPGDVIEYTVTIANSGDMSALNVVFTDTIDANTSLVPDSINVSPLAFDDIYAAVGNTFLEVGGTPSGNPALVVPGASLFDNDTEFLGDTFTLAAFDATSTQGGTVSVNANGSFSYLPPTGFTGSDTFTYSIEDGQGLTDQATVSITVSDRVWYVNNTAAAGGDGRANMPFNTLAAADIAANATGDYIFIHTGTGTDVGLNTGITLLNGQQLIGQGADLIVGPDTLVTAGGKPTIGNTIGDGVTLAMNNTIRGLTVGTTSGPAIKDGGGSVGTLIITAVNVNNSGNILEITNGGTLDVTFDDLVTTSASTAIDLDGVGGTFTVANTTSITGASAGIAVQSAVGSATFSFGSTSINSSGAAVNLDNNGSATFTFNSLAITTSGGPGLSATNSGTLNIGGTTNTITTVGGHGVELTNTTIGSGGMTFVSINVSGTDKGIVLNTVGANGFTVTGTGSTDASGGLIQNITQRGVEVISSNNVNLQNMNFTNANTTDSVSNCTGLTNSGCYAAIYFHTVTGATLDNVNISGTTTQQGINGYGVTDFTLTNSTITNAGTGVEEGGVRFFGLWGTSSIMDTTVAFSAERNVLIHNYSGALNLTAENNTFRDTQSSGTGADGLEVISYNAATATLRVAGNNFLRNRTNGLQVFAEDTSIVHVDVLNNTFDVDGGIGVGMDLSTNDSGQLTFNVTGNPTIHSNGGNAINVFADVASSVEGRINNNADIQVGGPGTNGLGIRVNVNGNATGIVEIDNNTVSNIGWDNGIQAMARGGSGRLDAAIDNNTVTVDADSSYDIWVQSSDSNATCANVTGNAASGNSTFSAAFRAREAGTSQLLLQGFDTNATVTWNNNGNTPVDDVSESGSASGGTCNVVSIPQPTVAQSQVEDSVQVSTAAAPLTITANAESVESTTVTSPEDNAATSTIAASSADETSATFITAPASSNSRVPGLARLFPASVSAPSSGEGINVDIGELPAGKTLTITFQTTIDTPASAGLTQVANQGTVQGSNIADVLSDDPDTGTADDPTVTPLDNELDLAIAKTDGQTVAAAGAPVTYTIVITNNGPYHVDGATVTDNVPAALTSPTWTCEAGPNATCGNASGSGNLNETFALSVSAQITYTLGATVDPNATGSLVNTAAVAPPAGFTDPTPPDNNSTTDTDTIVENQFSIDDIAMVEGDSGTTDFVFTVSSTNNSNAASVQVQTADDTAEAGSDYTAVALTTLNFPSGGALTQAVTVTVSGDTRVEADETFVVNLSNPVNGAIVDGQGTGTITNDDAATLSINDVTVDEGAGTATFTVTLSTLSALDTDMNFATSDGTAVAGIDYTAIAGTLAIPAGDIEGTIEVPVLDDALDEPNKTFTVTLSAPVNATLSDGQGIGTILDDEIVTYTVFLPIVFNGYVTAPDLIVSMSRPSSNGKMATATGTTSKDGVVGLTVSRMKHSKLGGYPQSTSEQARSSGRSIRLQMVPSMLSASRSIYLLTSERRAT